MVVALSPGSTSATTSVTPTCSAIRAAVVALSPVSMTVVTSRVARSATAALAVARGASATPKTPAGLPSTATATAWNPNLGNSVYALALEALPHESRGPIAALQRAGFAVFLGVAAGVATFLAAGLGYYLEYRPFG